MNCEECGVEFTALTKNKKYCSGECQDAARERARIQRREPRVRLERVCPTCGARFETKFVRQAFCCVTCRTKYNHMVAKNTAPRRITERKSVSKPAFRNVCEVCGDTFGTNKQSLSVCSNTCRTKRDNKKYHPRKSEKNTYGTKECICGKSFTRKTATDDFCSFECLMEAVNAS